MIYYERVKRIKLMQNDQNGKFYGSFFLPQLTNYASLINPEKNKKGKKRRSIIWTY